jgi:hypothetical protein
MDIDCLRGGLDEIDSTWAWGVSINPFTDDDFLCDRCIEKRFAKEQE